MNCYLIVGLGNYPPVYKKTRHNAGQTALVKLAQQLHLVWHPTKDNSKLAISSKDNYRFYFFQPHCYMNDSGRWIVKIVKTYQIPIHNIVVLYDDLDIELGKVKIKTQGSAGGHNGLQNIIDNLRSDCFTRIRIGIKPIKPKLILRREFVLGQFTLSEKIKLQSSYRWINQIMLVWMNNNYEWAKITSLYQQKNTSSN